MDDAPDTIWPVTGEYTVAPGAARYYSIAQAATALGVSRVTIWRWNRAGRLPVTRLGHRTTRIAHDDLDRFLARTRSAGPRTAAVPATEDATGDARERAPGAARPDLGADEHFVQFYESDAVLLDAVGAFIGAALQAGEAGIVVATAAHRAGLEAYFQSRGLDLADARAGGRYVALDAAETLARFMVDGSPDAGRFTEVVGEIIARAAEGGRRVRIFGEMVALLAADGRHTAAIRLEELWNEVRRTRPFALFCAYPLQTLGGTALAELLANVCAEHAHVIPAESYTALPTEETASAPSPSCSRRPHRSKSRSRTGNARRNSCRSRWRRSGSPARRPRPPCARAISSLRSPPTN